MVSQITASHLPGFLHSSQKDGLNNPTEQSNDETSFGKDEIRSFSFIRESIKSAKLPEDTLEIICASWKDSTKVQYRHYHKKWLQFCCKKQINPFTANVKNVLMFLTKLFMSGLGYSSINTARCSLITSFLSLDNSTSLSSNILGRRFMKGIFTLRPAFPRYNVTWDVNKVLNYLKKTISTRIVIFIGTFTKIIDVTFIAVLPK